MDSLAHTGATMVHGTAAVVLDDGATTYDTGAFTFSIEGKSYAKSAVTNGTSPTVDGNTGVAFTALAEDQGCMLLWSLDSGGTVKLSQGEIRALDPDSGDFLVAPNLPPVPADHCAFAYVVVQYTGSSTFTPGTSNWNASGVAKAVVNVSTLPSRVPRDATA